MYSTLSMRRKCRFLLAMLSLVLIPVESTAEADDLAKDLATSDRCSAMAAEIGKLRAIPISAQIFQPALGKVFMKRQSLPADVCNAISVMAAAGLVAAGDNASYVKMRTNLPDLESFENYITSECRTCHGVCSVNSKCDICFGTGICKSNGCHGGQKRAPQVGGGYMVYNCFDCKGTGVCPRCHGEGFFEKPCTSCGGIGRIIDRTAATRLFSEACDVAIYLCRHHAVVAVTATGTGESESVALDAAINDACARVHGKTSSARSVLLENPEGDALYGHVVTESSGRVKKYHITEKRKDENGLFVVKIRALVFKCVD